MGTTTADGIDGLLQCPVCDSYNDLAAGHFEINALLGEHAYIWLLSAGDLQESRRHGSTRSKLVGINFGSMHVLGSPRHAQLHGVAELMSHAERH